MNGSCECTLGLNDINLDKHYIVLKCSHDSLSSLRGIVDLLLNAGLFPPRSDHWFIAWLQKLATIDGIETGLCKSVTIWLYTIFLPNKPSFDILIMMKIFLFISTNSAILIQCFSGNQTPLVHLPQRLWAEWLPYDPLQHFPSCMISTHGLPENIVSRSHQLLCLSCQQCQW